MDNINSKFILLGVMASLLVSPAIAHPKHGKGQGEHGNGQWEEYESSSRHCPPGLAKKHNGCLPPGQAKKYRVGERLPAGVVWRPVPAYRLEHLEPAPYGTQYIQVDQDVLLMSEATKKILDAIVIGSAIR